MVQKSRCMSCACNGTAKTNFGSVEKICSFSIPTSVDQVSHMARGHSYLASEQLASSRVLSKGRELLARKRDKRRTLDRSQWQT
uniref:Uncharacterized protein n=1 Tax=Ditylenchus dipsaci TaxID=166011 RepID=A0A915DCV0_9BILA